jgi:hypothetical protein
MKKSFQKLVAHLSAAYPSGSSPYWRTLPLGQMKTLLAGTFLLASAAGFAANQMQLEARVGRGFFWPLFAGSMATGFLVGRIKKVRLMPFFLLLIAIVWLVTRASLGAPPPTHGRSEASRDTTG